MTSGTLLSPSSLRDKTKRTLRKLYNFTYKSKTAQTLTQRQIESAYIAPLLNSGLSRSSAMSSYEIGGWTSSRHKSTILPTTNLTDIHCLRHTLFLSKGKLYETRPTPSSWCSPKEQRRLCPSTDCVWPSGTPRRSSLWPHPAYGMLVSCHSRSREGHESLEPHPA